MEALKTLKLPADSTMLMEIYFLFIPDLKYVRSVIIDYESAHHTDYAQTNWSTERYSYFPLVNRTLERDLNKSIITVSDKKKTLEQVVIQPIHKSDKEDLRGYIFNVPFLVIKRDALLD